MLSTVYGLAESMKPEIMQQVIRLIKHVPSWHLLFMVWLKA